MALILAEGEAGDGFRYGMVAGLLGFGLTMKLILGGLTVLVKEDRLVLHLGSVPLVKKTVRFGEIQGMESVTYRPLRDFGGWGVRGVGSTRAWTASGSKALVLTLADGNRLFVGSADPELLAEHVRRAMRQGGW